MEFRTVVAIPKGSFLIEPGQQMLFVGSCFADNIGRRAQQEMFRATVNPFGVMYNPASVLHTIERLAPNLPPMVVVTLGTNHVYREKATGKIVDNCQKRPQNLFQEEILDVAQCTDYLQRMIALLRQHQPDGQVVFTVSPIRYRKYGYHESQLSKATLLLAVDRLRGEGVDYFPAYEIVLDELRDYRFYQPDMLHPSDQAVEYIWQRFGETYFSDRTRQFLAEWKPIKEALAHRPFNPDSEEYQAFLATAKEKERQLRTQYQL